MRELGHVLIRCSRGHLLCDMFKIFLWMIIHLDRPFKDEQMLDKGRTSMLNTHTHTHTHRWKNKRTGQVSLFLQASRQEVVGTVDLSDQFPSLSGSAATG